MNVAKKQRLEESPFLSYFQLSSRRFDQQTENKANFEAHN